MRDEGRVAEVFAKAAPRAHMHNACSLPLTRNTIYQSQRQASTLSASRKLAPFVPQTPALPASLTPAPASANIGFSVREFKFHFISHI